MAQSPSVPSWVPEWDPVTTIVFGVVATILTIAGIRHARHDSRFAAKVRAEDVARASQAMNDARAEAAEARVVREIGALYQVLQDMPDARDYFRTAQPWTPYPTDVSRYLNDLAPTVRWVTRYAEDTLFKPLAKDLPSDHPLRKAAVDGAFSTYVSRLQQLMSDVIAGLHAEVADEDQPNYLLYLHDSIQFTRKPVGALTTGNVDWGATMLAEIEAERRLHHIEIRSLAGRNWFPI